MDTLWIILLSAATPIASIVGFAIQLRTIKKTRLENEKLLLEIQKLKFEKELSERKLVLPTTQEVIEYNGIKYSVGDNNGATPRKPPKASFSENLLLFLILALAVIFFAYLVFDLYRLYTWLRSYFNF